MSAALLWIAILPQLAPAEPIRSADLRALLERQNEKVQAKAFEAEAAGARAGSLSRSFLPKVEADLAQERFQRGRLDWKTQPTYGIAATVNLFNGGRDLLGGRLADTRSARLSAEKKVAVYEELLKARETYWKILFYRELIALYGELEKENAQSLAAAEKRIRSGVATQSDRFEFEMKDIEIRQERGEAEAELSILTKELAALLGRELAHKLEFPERLSHDHEWEEMLKHGEKEHDFLSEPSRLAAEELGTASRLQARFWWPRLDAYAGWRQQNQLQENHAGALERREAVLGLRLSVLLFDGLRSRAEASAMEAETRAAESLASYAHRNVEVEIHRETTELRFLHSQVHDAEENIGRAQKYHALTQSEYSRGVKNSPDVLGAAEKLFQVRRKRIEILRDFQIAKAHVLSIIGR